jgi:hypothetical protein
VEYQQRFHVEPLLILDPINLGPTCSLKTLCKISFPSHAAAAGLPRKRLERTLPPPGPHRRHLHQDPIVAATAVSGPLRRRRHPCDGTSSTQLPRPLHRHRHWRATEKQRALARKRHDLTLPCHITALARTLPPP